jgi:hypothetical protein
VGGGLHGLRGGHPVNLVRLSRIDERDGLRTGNGAAQQNGQAYSEACAHGATTSLLRLRYLWQHSDDLSRAYHQYEFSGRGAPRIVICGSPAVDRNSNRVFCPSTRPRITKPRQNRFPDRYCQGGGGEVSSSQGSFPSGGRLIGER